MVKKNAEKLNPLYGLYGSFLVRTIFPLVLMTILVIGSGLYSVRKGLCDEAFDGLHSVACSVITMFDELYPGDYTLLLDEEKNVSYLMKGDQVISTKNNILESIKEKTGVDISIFFYDMRMMTTLKDEEGNSYVNTLAHSAVTEAVLNNGTESFYTSLRIAGEDYFVDYVPVFSMDGTTCIGIVAAAKRSDAVEDKLYEMIYVYAGVALLAILIAAFIMVNHITTIVGVIKKIMRFLGDIAQGRLNTTLDETAFSRKDELGEMARFTVRVQADLKKLIEKDPLTGLCNRRSCDNKFNDMLLKTNSFCIALGDIDFFKKVNDTYGHDAGDEVLRMVSKHFSEAMAGKGFAVRWGGEEFLLIFEDMSIEKAQELLQNTLNNIKTTCVTYEDKDIFVTMTMGLIEGKYDVLLDKQVSQVDTLLYYGKEHGRNQLVLNIPDEE